MWGNKKQKLAPEEEESRLPLRVAELFPAKFPANEETNLKDM